MKMKRGNIQKNLKYGLISSSVIVVIIIALVIVNVLLKQADISYDVSKDEVYSISEQSKKIVSGLDKDVTIYIIQSEPATDIGYKKILSEYEKAGKHIHIEYKDPTIYPSFAKETLGSDDEVSKGSLIVSCGKNARLVDSSSFSTYNSQTYETELKFEPLVTSAINYVASEETEVVYLTTGHGETDINSDLSEALQTDNYNVEKLNFSSMGCVPEDAAVVFIDAPASDFTKQECEYLEKYVDGGGNVYCVISYESGKLTNLFGLLKKWGIETISGLVVEQKSDMYYTQAPYYLFPSMEDSEITNPISESGYNVMTPLSAGMTIKDTDQYHVMPLLLTSDYAFAKKDAKSDATTKEEGDIDGPFTIAAISEYTGSDTETNDAKPGQIIVFGSSYAISNDFNQAVYGSNVDFVMNGIDYMNDQHQMISVRTKSIKEDSTVYTQKQAVILVLLALFVIPGAIIIVGIILCVIRKKRSKKAIPKDYKREKKKHEKKKSEKTHDKNSKEVKDDKEK